MIKKNHELHTVWGVQDILPAHYPLNPLQQDGPPPHTSFSTLKFLKGHGTPELFSLQRTLQDKTYES